MSLKVLLIDDHMLFREGLISLLQRRNIEVLAAVGDGNEGIRLAQEMQPDIVLLDNMSLEQLCEAVSTRDRLNPQVELEASGGVTLETVRGIAETGVDRISVGALTHSAISVDVGLDWLETFAEGERGEEPVTE